MAKAHRLRLNEFIYKIYLPYARLVKKSWTLDERIASRHIAPVFGETFLDRIESAKVAEWFYSLSLKGLAPSTCNRILAVFRAICHHALKTGLLNGKDLPCKNVKPHKIKVFRQKFLSLPEARSLLVSLKKEKCLAACAISLLLLTGARKSEILQARWENLDLENRRLFVPVSKSGKSREILLSSEAVAILAKLNASRRNQWLFPGKKNRCLSDIYAFWDDFRKRNGLEGMRIHDLRHSFASFLVNTGHSLYETQLLLGHANPRTTMRYAHLDSDLLLKTVESVGVILKQQPSDGRPSKTRRSRRKKLFKEGEKSKISLFSKRAKCLASRLVTWNMSMKFKYLPYIAL